MFGDVVGIGGRWFFPKVVEEPRLVVEDDL